MEVIYERRVDALAADPAACEPRAILDAVDRLDFGDAACRIVAAAQRGTAVTAEIMAEVYPRLEVPSVAIPLIALSTGNRARALLELSEMKGYPDDVYGMNLEAAGLYAAFRMDSALTPRILAQARKRAWFWARLDESGVAPQVCAELAREAGDSLLAELVPPFRTQTPHANMVRMVLGATTALAIQLTIGSSEILDTQPDISGRVPKVGRNEPCPCGSGAKYKRCHGTEPRPNSPHSRRQTAKARRKAESLTMVDVQTMPLTELAKLQLSRLPARTLWATADRLLKYRVWRQLERVAAELDRRTQSASSKYYTPTRLRLANHGIAGRQFDFARAQTARLPPEGRSIFELEIELAERSFPIIDELDRVAGQALRDESGDLGITFSHALLEIMPALGVLVARGCLHYEGPTMLKYLLANVEIARVGMGMVPGDPGWEILAVLQETEQQREQHQQRDQDRRVTEAQDRAEQLREALRDASRRGRDLSRRVQELEERLAAERPEKPARSKRSPSSADPEEVRRLREKIQTLKEMVRERNEERSALRRQLATVDRDDGPSQAIPVRDQPAENDGDDVGATESSHRVLIPAWTRRAGEALRSVPRQVAASALRKVAALAGADEAAWEGVKRPKGMPRALFMTRVGIHHRLLFEVDGDVLSACELVTRQSLDVTLKRLRAS